MWNRPTYEKSPLSGPDSGSPHMVASSRTTTDHQAYESSNTLHTSVPSKSKENLDSLNHPSSLNALNISVANDIKIFDHVDNQQTPGTATLLLPSPTLPREPNQHLLHITPLKISVKKATKYRGLSKSLGIKVCS